MTARLGVAMKYAPVPVLLVAIGSPHQDAKKSDDSLMRPAGESTYRLQIKSDEGGQERVLVADFIVRTEEDTERIFLLRASMGPVNGDSKPLGVDPTWQEQSIGPSDPPEALGSFTLPQSHSLDDLVPAGVSEPVFGAVTDFLTFLQVQSEGFGMDRLTSPGDKVRFEPFTVSWSRPPATLGARISCPGGFLTWRRGTESTAVVLFEPDPMDLLVLRDVPGGSRMLLIARESLALEVRIAVESGRLLGGRSTLNVLEVRVQPGVRLDALPEAGEVTPSSGLLMTINRSLELRMLEDD